MPMAELRALSVLADMVVMVYPAGSEYNYTMLKAPFSISVDPGTFFFIYSSSGIMFTV